jgi:hypothetical protein
VRELPVSGLVLAIDLAQAPKLFSESTARAADEQMAPEGETVPATHRLVEGLRRERRGFLAA